MFSFRPAHSAFSRFSAPFSPPSANDHEPPIAHHSSYDADRCIHRNDHGQPRGRITPARKQAALLPRSRDHRQGIRPRLHLENPRPRRRPRSRRVLPQRRPGRGTARPLVGSRSPGPRPRPRPGRQTCAVRRGVPADRPAHRSQAPTALRPLPDLRRPPGPAHGRRAARHRRTAHRTRTRSRPGHPAARRLLRRHHLLLQVHLDPARLHPRERTPRPPRRRPGSRRVLGRAGAAVPRGAAPGQSLRAGVPAGLGRDHPHRLPRHPSTAASPAGSRPPG